MSESTTVLATGSGTARRRALKWPQSGIKGHGRSLPPWENEVPIRAELLSIERLQEHALGLAAAQTAVSGKSKGAPLVKRLAENESILLSAYADIARAVDAGASITPAAEWLFNNFHLVERQIRDIRADLPPGYYRQLPKLLAGPFTGYPRILSVIWAFIAHTDSLFDPEALRPYLKAYQSVQPLLIGELWAVAITLRVVLVENLRRMAMRIIDSRAGRAAADAVADRLLGANGRAEESADVVLASVGENTVSGSFLVQLVHRLRDQDARIAPALLWLDAQLAAQGTSADAVVRDEHQRQVAGSVTVRNIITSMRLISDVDWTQLFETVSLVDEVFSASGCFQAMDFPTRNLYRSAVESLARGCRLTELEIAHAAVDAAMDAAEVAKPGTPITNGGAKAADPGYYLIADGRPGFEARIGFRPSLGNGPGRLYRRLGIGGYVAAGGLVTAALLVAPLSFIRGFGIDGDWALALAILAIVPASDLAVALVNLLVTRGYRASRLPALNLRSGVPDSLKTLIVVPTLLTALDAISEQVERLEIHFLASPPGALHFALLSDWVDSGEEHAAGDEALLAAARLAIAKLNARYDSPPGVDRFLLLHRRRVWTQSEGCWMGWERKRGKLNELNRWLRGARDTTFIDPSEPPADVRYVITLDSDTRLPRETVSRLIGKMAHPLNQPRLDPSLGRVVEGHAILQPRVTPALPTGREGSLFLRVFASAAGIDPYAAAVSDVYQDLFGEGSYTGKGIYDVDAFEASLAGRVPDSTLLSHDLFEGIFARAGLASDVEVVEDFPARYEIAAQRHHRWVRGDWQLLSWAFAGGPAGAARRGVPAVGRWKMIDNLRRSLSPPAFVAALIAGWAMPSLAASALWTAFIVTTVVLPPLLPVIMRSVARSPGVTLRSHLRALHIELNLGLIQSGLMLVFLADQAWLVGDAVLRTLTRLFFTRQHLLQWVSTAQTATGPRPGLGGLFRRMPGATVISVLGVAVAALWGQQTWPMALVFAVAWLASPIIALWASQSPKTSDRLPLTAAEIGKLRQIARLTWRYFEAFVTSANHDLPPDNFQETPSSVEAHRTSPTNIGLYMLSTASARDMGWIGTLEATERLEATLSTLAGMDQFRGHLFNWYDTRTLRPLDPQYISSVDSGNLAGHLIAVAGACAAWRGLALEPKARIDGIIDALALAQDEAGGLRHGGGTQSVLWRQFDDVAGQLQRELALAVHNEITGEAEWKGSLRAWLAQAVMLADTSREICILEESGSQHSLRFWTEAVRRGLESHLRDADALASALNDRLCAVEVAARAVAMAMEFDFLLDPDRLLLSIGYQVREAALDPSCYDLLASEARLASFFAIAKGDAPARHWFRLSHALTPVAQGAALISWSGSMFEYLMPSLVMRAPAESVIEQTNRLIVGRQIAYGATLKTPWGVSESAYNTRDLEFTYQYSNFGIPGLGLKQGLADNVVIAPYATALAAMVAPQSAVANFDALAILGAKGRYGFYEAVDFTPGRAPGNEPFAIVRAFMAHHQGMTITAIADTLLDGLMRDRFHAEPIIKATELLLQERAPRDVTATTPPVSASTALSRIRDTTGFWRSPSPWASTPATQLLSNGRYSVMLTAAGSGYSTWGDLAVTRWREDGTRDDWGSYILLRDTAGGGVWSATYQPIGAEPDAYEVTFNEDRAQFTRRDGGLVTTLEVLVSAEDDAEVRRVKVFNTGDEPREIEVTSFAEIVLAPAAADIAHPAFSKLFVETEHLAGLGAILAHRRRRAPTEPETWAAHLAVVDGVLVGKLEFETDRARFLGRGIGLRAPGAAINGRPLSGTTGTVLDPVFALRRTVRIPPGGTARIDFWTMVADSRAGVLTLIDKNHDAGAFARAAALAWTQAQVQLHHLGIDRAMAGQFQRLAGYVVHASAALRPPSATIMAGVGGQADLWSLGISGDLPIVLVRLSDSLELNLVRDALQAVEYWRMKRLAVDLVILNEHGVSYVQDLQIALEALVRASQSRPQIGESRLPGHVFVLRGDLISPATRSLLASVARVVLVGERGGLADQVVRAPEARALPRRAPVQSGPISELQVSRREPNIEYFNGLGGFSENGREYTTILGPGQSTPAPWINVIANANFGFQVSAEGGGYAWSVNSREHQLTPWSNDPVTDNPGQAVYIRDEETGQVWSPTALPIRDETAIYTARHGWGYSRFEHAAYGVAAQLLEFVPLQDPVKITRLTLRNTGTTVRRLSVTAYAEWVLGAARGATAPFVVTRLDPGSGAVLASNAWNPAFAERVAFVAMVGRTTTCTGDRREFIGRNGTLSAPAGLVAGARLSGRVGAGLDPCAAVQTLVHIPPGGSVEVVILLGDGADEAAALELIGRYQSADLDQVLAGVTAFWDRTVGTVQVKTPDRSMDIMLNGWLTYQTLACRIWARCGFYQASGAYGFRDQLQDFMALAQIHPQLTREHLIRAAGRQFPEGDVQHWWLPHSGQGVRTRISDDRVWLAYATAHYIRVTGDAALLEAVTPFLAGEILADGEHERFFAPTAATDHGDIYDHCARALDASLAFGEHGLPLIGAGDWNDGMNRVGENGRGESVWLAWLLRATLTAFVPFADARGDLARAAHWRAQVLKLDEALGKDAWDGGWFRRGWFDDGTPLGSAVNAECRIDQIAQSWAVLSGATLSDDETRARAIMAMAAVERELIRTEDGLALLFTPPFDNALPDPGYIKGYPPGLRENGGQYTHAALWSVMALAGLGQGDKAAALFWLLNPINHARSRADIHRYKVEPYVVAADVYAAPGHIGRGGWTWYTGSAGWMQRAGLESILGLQVEDGRLRLDPCIPASWPGFEMTLRLGASRYEISVRNPASVQRGVVSATLDGVQVSWVPLGLKLIDDGDVHLLQVDLGPRADS